LDDVTLTDQASNTIVPGTGANAAPPASQPASAPPASAPGATRRRHGRIPRLAKGRINVRVRTLDSLHNRNFLLLWLSTLWLGGGFWVQQLIVGWLAYDLTRSAFLTSVAVGLQMAPFLIGGPLGGVIADRWDRRKSLLGLIVYQAVVAAVFATIVILGRTATWHIFAFAVAMGLAWAMSDPFRTALIPNLVPRERLLNAFALNGLAFNLMRFLMPAAAGFLIVLVGPGPTMLLGVATYIGAGLAIGMMRTEQADVDKTERSPRSTPFTEFTEALLYVKREPRILGILLLGVMPPFLLVPFVSGLMPVYASEVFSIGPSGLGILMSAVGIGGMFGSMVVASLGDIRYKGRAMIGALMISVIAAVLFSRTGSPLMALPFLAAMAAGLPSFFAINGAAIQSIVPDHLRGRVTSISATLIGLMPVGGLAAGALAEHYGAPTATLIAGAVFVASMALLSLKYRHIWSTA